MIFWTSFVILFEILPHVDASGCPRNLKGDSQTSCCSSTGDFPRGILPCFPPLPIKYSNASPFLAFSPIMSSRRPLSPPYHSPRKPLPLPNVTQDTTLLAMLPRRPLSPTRPVTQKALTQKAAPPHTPRRPPESAPPRSWSKYA